MRAPLFERAVPLRVDVDFRPGLLRAVPAMLDRLAEYGMRASFFVVAGSNRPASSIPRLLDRSYRRRLARLGPWRVLSLLRDGSASMLDSAEARAVVRRIESDGHELVVHGWDHAWWADNVRSADATELDAQIDLAFDEFTRVAGPRRRAWGSPNWRSREDVIASLVGRDVPYLSECWGRSPFLSQGRPHLPVTDNLEARVLEHGPSRDCVDEMFDARERGVYRLICAHDYFEGLLYPDLFGALLEGCRRRGLRAVSLAEIAERLDAASLEEHRLEDGAADGFCGTVSRQASCPEAVVTSALL